jgi:anti-anti-sigma regulatory factor
LAGRNKKRDFQSSGSHCPLSVERQAGRALGTRILRFSGPLTLRNLFTFQNELRQGPELFVVILDLTKVPFMDLAGMGALINYYATAKKSASR